MRGRMWRLEANLSCLSSGDIHFLLLVFVVEPLTSSKLVKLAQLAISTCLCITQGWDYKCIPLPREAKLWAWKGNQNKQYRRPHQ